MKKLYFILGLVIVALLVSSCGGGSPEASAKKFYSALEKGDMKALATVATPETVELMTQFSEKAQQSVAKNGKLVSATSTIDGDTAVVKMKFENDEDELNLVKQGGKWLVTMSK